MTASSTTALLQSLYAEVQQLEAQIASLKASMTAPAQAPTFAANLSLYDTGADVLVLQQFLNSHGFPIATTGPGSPGEETSFFGLATYRALVAYQAANDLPATGFFGPQTRALISGSSPTGQGSNTLGISSSNSLSQQGVSQLTSIPAAGYGGGGGTVSNTNNSGGGGGGSNPTPSVSLTAPASNAYLSGSSVTLTATASESGGMIASVQFEVDGTSIATVSSSPYTTTWDSTGVSDGAHTLYAVAKDASGNYATSTESVTVENTPVSISSISSGTPTTTAATITWTTNEAASSTILYGTTASYGSASSSASFATSHSIMLTNLVASTTYDFQVQVTNAAGSSATSTNQTFTTTRLAGPDTTPPTTPTDLTAVAASVSELDLSWTASNDNGGGDSCCSYQIYRDGSEIATTSATTYADTGLAASSTHSYIINAYDAAGNVSSASNTATSTTGVWDDGDASAPSGTPELPTLLEGYNARAPWHVAGVDYYVGVPSGTTLKDPTVSANLPACASVDSVNHLIRVNADNCTLGDFDFSLHGGYELYIGADNTTVEDSNFEIGTNNTFTNIEVLSGYHTLTVLDSTLDGGGDDAGVNAANVDAPIYYVGTGGTLTMEYNWIKRVPHPWISTTQVIDKYNLKEDFGYTSSSHGNGGLFVGSGSSTAPAVISNSQILFNTVYSEAPNPTYPLGTCEGLQIAANNFTNMSDTDAAYNTVISRNSPSGNCYLVHAIVLDAVG